MKVKMKSLAAGPAGVHHAGHTVDVPPKQAREFHTGGYAEIVETATAPAPERAVAPRQRGRRERPE